ncbi:MAG: AAA family ATPase [Anaerolineae bacterium]|nr:AAA family ATPase [Anaerolineae bacterium]
MSLHPQLITELKTRHQQSLVAGELPSREQLARYYATFRARFAPEQLQRLDGEALLETLHNHSNHDSLVYWLEFKNDDELPAIFGSIAGGSALKFGIYRRKETGAWMTGSPQNQQELTTADAIEIARRHRDQLVRGAELLAEFPVEADDTAYQRLQAQIDTECPDISDTAWGHKYFSLLYPDKLDDYHVENYQRFHLIKLLQIPPEGGGRYLAAGWYVAIARELDIPLNHLTTMLNQRDGTPYRFWRIGTTLGGKDSRWDMMRTNNCVAIGWAELGDLSSVTSNKESKEWIREALRPQYPTAAGALGKQTQQVFNFVTAVAEGDLVLPSEGKRILGIGRVTGGYIYIPDSDMPHRRAVEWLALGPWEFPETEGLQTIVHEIRKPINQVAIEKHVLEAPSIQDKQSDDTTKRSIDQSRAGSTKLTGILGRIQAILERKGQVILYGPPGTGKTYWALRAARELAARAAFGQSFDVLDAAQKPQIQSGDRPLVRLCTFHPAYGYEDFLEGYRPQTHNGQLAFEQRAGIFKHLCADAASQLDRRFYLIIDEINRGDIPRIFGELLTLLERDKRGQIVQLPLSGEPFSVPPNVYIIGTMNTADRSIALLDTALRRRFGFVELLPDPDLLGDAVLESIPLGPWLASLNRRILEHIGRDARNLQIGHAYLLEGEHPVREFTPFARVVQDDLIPLLEEYCYEDYAALARILGDDLVDEAAQRVRYELFDPAHRADLVRALLKPDPDVLASRQAIAAEQEAAEVIAEEDSDNGPEDSAIA